eukprot:TRINITY_DN888_c0_g1_i1.p1 TRINITY_DN888_c0_g1~~TRINITY_DN888_c0_g1_i1.p1  ORF type:complete len:115 (+),score=43.45 TRINITY_DN888_c0_g1_i1:127-471(+)
MDQVISEEVTGAALLNGEGSVVASSGDKSMNKTVGAITSNIWSVYVNSGEQDMDDQVLDFLLIENEEGRLAVTQVTDLILCVFGGKDCEMGLLKQKMDTLSEYLSPQLENLGAS